MGEGIYTKGLKTTKQPTRYEDHKRHLTEAGMTLAQRKTVLELDEKYRNRKNEILHAVARDGSVIEQVKGRGKKVPLTGEQVRLLKDAVVTHNHPGSIGESGINSIGNSFSAADLKTAVAGNAAEMRAVTPRYTFSFRRNGDKWKVSEKEIGRIIREVGDKIYAEGSKHIDRHDWSNASVDRANITINHKIAKEVAKRIGATYTHKRNH